MGIIARFRDIMAANINALLDKAEDPEKMIDQLMRDLVDNLADVKKCVNVSCHNVSETCDNSHCKLPSFLLLKIFCCIVYDI